MDSHKRATVEVRDSVIWIKHLHGSGAESLADLWGALSAGALVRLEVDGHEGIWEKMKNGADGRATPGIKPISGAKTAWEATRASGKDLVEVLHLAEIA